MKQAKTIEEQIAILKDRSKVIIEDEEYARQVLLNIGYYRLGFALFPFEQAYPNKDDRTHICHEGTRLEDVVRLYHFDNELRHLLLKYLHYLEVNFRTKVVYFVSNTYPQSPTWFADDSVMTEEYIKKDLHKRYAEIRKNHSVIERHHQKYQDDDYAPAWKTLEFMTFGAMIRLYKSLRSIECKEQIMKEYSLVDLKYFLSYIDVMRKLRNSCAHGNPIFDWHLDKPIKKIPGTKITPKEASSILGAIMALHYFMEKISKKYSDDLKRDLQSLLKDISDLRPLSDLAEGINNSF